MNSESPTKLRVEHAHSSNGHPVNKRKSPHSRVERILRTLQEGEDRNVRQLAVELEVSRRTIYRDLNAIRDGGTAIYFDEEADTYRLASGAREVDPTGLTADDAALLLLVAQIPQVQELPGVTEWLQTAVRKLVAGYPKQTRKSITRIATYVEGNGDDKNTAVPEGISPDVVCVLLRALRVRQKVILTTDSKTGVQFAPERLLEKSGRWCVAGQDLTANQRKIVPLGEIRQAKRTEEQEEIKWGVRNSASPQ